MAVAVVDAFLFESNKSSFWDRLPSPLVMSKPGLRLILQPTKWSEAPLMQPRCLGSAARPMACVRFRIGFNEDGEAVNH